MSALYAIRLAIYIDDLVLQISGIYLTGVVSRATNIVRKLFFDVIEKVPVLPMARDKVYLVGSSTQVVEPVLENLKPEGFQALPETKLLGISCAAAKDEPNSVLPVRIHSFRKRVSKLRTLNKTRAQVGGKITKTVGHTSYAPWSWCHGCQQHPPGQRHPPGLSCCHQE